jgi:hypothetical protein
MNIGGHKRTELVSLLAVRLLSGTRDGVAQPTATRSRSQVLEDSGWRLSLLPTLGVHRV